MITVDDVAAALDSTGLAWTNETWHPGRPPALPYLVLSAEGSREVCADNVTALSLTRYRVELYSHGRDYEREALVSGALRSAGVAFSRRHVGVIDQTDVTETCWLVTARD